MDYYGDHWRFDYQHCGKKVEPYPRRTILLVSVLDIPNQEINNQLVKYTSGNYKCGITVRVGFNVSFPSHPPKKKKKKKKKKSFRLALPLVENAVILSQTRENKSLP